MTLEQLWTIIHKQWRLVLLCFAVVGVGTFCISKCITPTYQSTVLVQVTLHASSVQSDYNSLMASDQLVQTEVQLATSDPVLREVASHYSRLTVDALAKRVTATSKLNTQLFEIDVQDVSPTGAAQLANDVAATLIKQQLQQSQLYNKRSQQQIQQDLDGTKQQINAVNEQLSSLNPGNQAQVTALQNQLTTLQQHYGQWQTSLAQLELSEAQNSDYLRVAQPAQPASAPVKPQILLNTIIGLLAGALLGIILAILFEQSDTHIRTAEQLSELLRSPVLATIQRVDGERGEGVTSPQGQQINAEAYRMLRTNIGFSSIDKPLRTFAITSATAQEGRTTTSINLAMFMAKAGKSTLLIDADFRQPTIAETFGLAPEKLGLSNAIIALARSQFHINPVLPKQSARGYSLEPYMHSVGIPNLRVMPSGPLPPNSSELLDSKAMGRFFQAVENCAIEMIIFDTPALLGLSDANILAAKVDGTLVVADMMQAKKEHMSRVKATLAQSGANVIGCIANKAGSKHRRTKPAFVELIRKTRRTARRKKSRGTNSLVQPPVTPILPVTPIPLPAYGGRQSVLPAIAQGHVSWSQ